MRHFFEKEGVYRLKLDSRIGVLDSHGELFRFKRLLRLVIYWDIDVKRRCTELKTGSFVGKLKRG